MNIQQFSQHLQDIVNLSAEADFEGWTAEPLSGEAHPANNSAEHHEVFVVETATGEKFQVEIKKLDS